MNGALSQAVDRIRLLLLAVACWLCFVPTAHAIRPPSPTELQLREETPSQEQPAYEVVLGIDAEGRTGLLCVNDPLRYTDPTGHAPSDWANTMQPGIDIYYGGYIANPSHTSTIGLFGAYMGQSVANGYNDMLRFGNGMEQGTATGIAQDIGRASGIILTVAGPASTAATRLAPADAAVPKVAPEVTPAPEVGGVTPIKNPITAKPGELQTVDPNNLTAGQRATLVRGRLDAQTQLQQNGTPRNGGPPTVYENGVINDGHHAVRAAADSGQPVTVKVMPGQGATVTGKPVTQLPVHEN
ncbi:MAG: hypothetical protein ACLQUR_05580 [Limisphaerales bacterium]